MSYVRGITHDPTSAGYWATQSYYADTAVVEQNTANLSCNRITVAFGRSTPSGTVEDRAVFTLTVAKIVGGGLYSSLLVSELPAIELAMDNLLTTMQTRQAAGYTCNEYIWHEHRADNPPTEHGYEMVGPAIKRTAKSIAGSAAASRLPDQNTMSCSIRTASRKHWGRFYFPGIAWSQIDPTYGRFINGAVDGLASALRAFDVTATAASVQVGVWTWKYKAFLPMSEIRVDDVVDIQRRRRAKRVNYFKSWTS